MTNMPNRNSITSQSMAASAAGGVIWPVSSTASAPPSIACQMATRKRPTRRAAMMTKTISRTNSDRFKDGYQTDLGGT